MEGGCFAATVDIADRWLSSVKTMWFSVSSVCKQYMYVSVVYTAIACGW